MHRKAIGGTRRRTVERKTKKANHPLDEFLNQFSFFVIFFLGEGFSVKTELDFLCFVRLNLNQRKFGTKKKLS
jgi:hypothetical protein